MHDLDSRILDFTILNLEEDYPEQFKDRDHPTQDIRDPLYKYKTNISKLAAALDEQLKSVQTAIIDLYKYRTIDGGYPIRTATQEFIGDGSETEFTLTGDVYELYSIERSTPTGYEVIPDDEYTFDLATKKITFNEAPTNGVVITVYYRYQQDWAIDYADKQLDNAGDIVVLSRAEAGVISSPNMDKTLNDVMDNEDYAKYLQYKAYKNSSECTYYDLMTMLTILCKKNDDDQIDIGYREDPAHPATIYVRPSTWDINFPPVAPAGVGFIVERVSESVLNMYAGMGNIMKTTYGGSFDATTS